MTDHAHHVSRPPHREDRIDGVHINHAQTEIQPNCELKTRNSRSLFRSSPARPKDAHENRARTPPSAFLFLSLQLSKSRISRCSRTQPARKPNQPIRSTTRRQNTPHQNRRKTQPCGQAISAQGARRCLSSAPPTSGGVAVCGAYIDPAPVCLSTRFCKKLRQAVTTYRGIGDCHRRTFPALARLRHVAAGTSAQMQASDACFARALSSAGGRRMQATLLRPARTGAVRRRRCAGLAAQVSRPQPGRRRAAATAVASRSFRPSMSPAAALPDVAPATPAPARRRSRRVDLGHRAAAVARRRGVRRRAAHRQPALAGRHRPHRPVRRGLIGSAICRLAGRRVHLRRARRSSAAVGRAAEPPQPDRSPRRGDRLFVASRHRLRQAGLPHADHHPRRRPRGHQGQAVRAGGHQPRPGHRSASPTTCRRSTR